MRGVQARNQALSWASGLHGRRRESRNHRHRHLRGCDLLQVALRENFEQDALTVLPDPEHPASRLQAAGVGVFQADVEIDRSLDRLDYVLERDRLRAAGRADNRRRVRAANAPGRCASDRESPFPGNISECARSPRSDYRWRRPRDCPPDGSWRAARTRSCGEFASRSWPTSVPGVTDHPEPRKQPHCAFAPRPPFRWVTNFSIYLANKSLSIFTASRAACSPRSSS